jgi:hypothetical protein
MNFSSTEVCGALVKNSMVRLGANQLGKKMREKY